MKTKALISFAVIRGYREADLRFCFAYAKSRFSHNEAHYIYKQIDHNFQQSLIYVCEIYLPPLSGGIFDNWKMDLTE